MSRVRFVDSLRETRGESDRLDGMCLRHSSEMPLHFSWSSKEVPLGNKQTRNNFCFCPSVFVTFLIVLGLCDVLRLFRSRNPVTVTGTYTQAYIHTRCVYGEGGGSAFHLERPGI